MYCVFSQFLTAFCALSITSVMDTPLEALQQALAYVNGSQTELAEQLTERLQQHPDPCLRGRIITQAHVAMWLHRGRVTAGDMCGVIEELTGVPRVALRPDLFYEVRT